MPLAPLAKKLLLPLLALFLLPTAASAQRILRYSDHEPLGGMRTRFLEDVLFAAIEKESNGRLKIEGHWNSSVSTGYDALRVVRDGKLTDMAIVVPEYSANEMPVHQLFKSFPAGPSGEAQVAFFRKTYAEIPAFRTELEKNGVVEIFLATGYPVAFFSTAALNTLNDLKGQSWRSASFWHQAFLANAKAKPVSIPWGEEVFKAMRGKTLDGLMVNMDSGYDLKIPEVAPHVLVSKNLWLGHLYVLAMNRNTWNGLTQQDKEAVQRASQTAYTRLGQVMDDSFDTMVGDLKKGGVELRLLDRDEVAAWSVATHFKDVQDTWVNDQLSKGVTDAAVVLKKVTEIINTATSWDKR